MSLRSQYLFSEHIRIVPDGLEDLSILVDFSASTYSAYFWRYVEVKAEGFSF